MGMLQPPSETVGQLLLFCLATGLTLVAWTLFALSSFVNTTALRIILAGFLFLNTLVHLLCAQ
eukprot:2428019-Prymnesium_polylepis.1